MVIWLNKTDMQSIYVKFNTKKLDLVQKLFINLRTASHAMQY